MKILNISNDIFYLDFKKILKKRFSLVEMDFEEFNLNQENVIKMAEAEELGGHKLSVKVRQMDKKLI